jgi:hypothetical protein
LYLRETQVTKRLAIGGVRAHTGRKFVVDDATDSELTADGCDRLDIGWGCDEQALHVVAEQMGEFWLRWQRGGGNKTERIRL